MPSINDNGSTRSVVHTPDKVTLLKKSFEKTFLWLKMSSGKIYSEPQPFPCSWTDSWKITSTPYSAAFRSWFQGLKSNQFHFSIKPTKKETNSKLGNFRSEASEPRRLPFVIEKTIHNILFIKTHMQRQDEFDAVMPMAIMVMIKNYDGGTTIPVCGFWVKVMACNKQWKSISSPFSAILLHIEQSFKEALHTIMNLIPLHLAMITFKRGLRCFMNTLRGLLGGASEYFS